MPAETGLTDAALALQRFRTVALQQAMRVADTTAFFSVDVDNTSGDRTGELVEYDRTEKIFSQPSDSRTEDYVTGRFG